jgi:hypothetical protein
VRGWLRGCRGGVRASPASHVGVVGRAQLGNGSPMVTGGRVGDVVASTPHLLPVFAALAELASGRGSSVATLGPRRLVWRCGSAHGG